MKGSLQQIAVSELGDTVGTPPSQRLRDSVARMGIVQPVMLTSKTNDDGEIQLLIVDGNRRVAAAREAGLEIVPAIVFDELEAATIAETTLATNGFRSANYLAEFWALKQLERSKYQYEEILAASGMGSSTIKNRNSLSQLNRELFVGLRNGQIGQTEALAASRLPSHQQEMLVEKFRRYGKLARKDLQSLNPTSSASSGDKIADSLGDLAAEANKLGYNKAEFLELAARKWDELNG